MKIAFLTSSLEAGKDGVGDYTRSLAMECLRLGHEGGLLALHDRRVSAPITEEHPPTLRLPATMPWGERGPRARAFCAALDPQWISLQFGPYAFHDKGFAWTIAGHLRPLVAGRRVHVMFHELWLGGYQGASFKERLIGTVQRACVFHLLRILRPSVISTSNAAYVRLLQRGGFEARWLPMFGSIPFAEGADGQWVHAEIRRTVPSTRPEELWVFAIFGSLHSIWPPEPLFRFLQEAGERCGKKIVVLSIGKLGPGEALWNRLETEYAGRIHLVKLGQRSTAEVSAALQASDFGIATSPWELLGKSSSVSTLREHGLPVIVNRDDVHFGGVDGAELGDPLLIKMDAQLPMLLPRLQKSPPQSGVPVSTREFLRLFDPASNPTP